MIARNLLTGLRNHLSQKEITLIVGPRQAGKTTLMQQLRRELESKEKKTVYLNLDIEADRQFFVSQEKLLERIRLEVGTSTAVIFIDEMQRKENAGLFLKGIYDMNLPYKLVVTGSGSLELKEKIHESLTGRKQLFELSTVSFDEFGRHRLGNLFPIDKIKSDVLLEEYLAFGGYPRVVLSQTTAEKHQTIDEIFRSYVERDIAVLLAVKKTEAFTQLVRILASQAGNLINVSELSSTLGISIQTVAQYLWYLERTYVISLLRPLSKRVRKEITKAPTVYFFDLGLRNYATGVFNVSLSPNERGFLFQNLIYGVLRDRFRGTGATVHFWRTKDGAEVDFVIAHGTTLIPIEVKYHHLTRPQITRSLRSFIARYHVPKAYVINLSLSMVLKEDSTDIHFLPYTDIYTQNVFASSL